MGFFMNLIYGILSSGCLKGLSRCAGRMLNGTYHRKQFGVGAQGLENLGFRALSPIGPKL